MVASLPNAKVGAIIVAAGASSRMGAAGDKTLADLAGEPLIARTVDVFERCADVECIALVVSERNHANVAAIRNAKGWRKTTPPVLGGARRQDSVRAGLEALPKDCGWVVVHDGARPFVTAEMIEAGLDAARHTGAAVAVVPAFDTVKRVAPDGEDVAVVVLEEGLAVDAVDGVEVLGEAELGALFGFDEFVLGDEEAPLLGVVALDGAALAVVSHVRLQIGLFAGPILSTNYLTSTGMTGWRLS